MTRMMDGETELHHQPSTCRHLVLVEQRDLRPGAAAPSPTLEPCSQDQGMCGERRGNPLKDGAPERRGDV